MASLNWRNTKVSEGINSWWINVAPKPYEQLKIKSVLISPIELQLGRKYLGRISAARTGYRNFAPCHTRFKHTESYLNCKCSVIEPYFFSKKKQGSFSPFKKDPKNIHPILLQCLLTTHIISQTSSS